jgi:5-methylcytosine-specific restriction endonuclease McrA
MAARTKPCSHIDRNGRSCPHLQPCELHPGRPKNAPWSPDRDTTQQGEFRRAVLERDKHRCTRCGSTWKLVAHHVKPGYDVSCGVTLCGRCHGIVDRNAR